MKYGMPDEVIDSLLLNKSLEEQVKILKACFDHAISHPWADEDYIDSVLENIQKDKDLL